MRKGEIFKLTWDKVDIGRKYIRLGEGDKKQNWTKNTVASKDFRLFK